MGDLFQEMMDTLREPQPPLVSAILTHHSVPYGRIFRQWDSEGRLWVWVNRGELEDLPRGPRKNSFNANSVTYDFSAIPIHHC